MHSVLNHEMLQICLENVEKHISSNLLSLAE